jgi:hypothetical protein
MSNSIQVSVPSSGSSEAPAPTSATAAFERVRKANEVLRIEGGEEPPVSRIGVPSHADGDDLEDVLGFVRQHAVGIPADQSIKLPLPRVRCIDLLRSLRDLQEETLHPFGILHARSRPLFKSLDFKNERDLTEMAFLVEQLRLPPSLIVKIRQYKSTMGLRVADPWFDSSNGGAAGGDAPSFAGFVGELTDIATSFTESIMGWWYGGGSSKKDTAAANAAKSQRQSSAAALVEATRGTGRLRQRLMKDPVLKPLWEGALACLPLLEINGSPAQLDDCFLDGLCGDPFTPASSATVSAGASAPSLGGAGGAGSAGAAAPGSAPASHAGNKEAVEPGATAQSRYLAGRLAAGHPLPRGVRYEASMANDSLPLQAAASVGNIPALKDLMSGGWKFDRSVSAAAAKNGQVETLKWISADCDISEGGSGGVFDASTCAAAALAPTSEALQWLRENKVEWDCRVIKTALAAGNKETLEWARTQKCPEF